LTYKGLIAWNGVDPENGQPSKNEYAVEGEDFQRLLADMLDVASGGDITSLVIQVAKL
jgi:hypothetical protein